MNRNATIKEFAAELNISERLAYGMARCEEFLVLGIAFDIRPKSKKKKNSSWRIDLERYYKAREKRLI